MTNETKKSEVIDWNAPFRAEDFECLIDNDYSEMDERACRVANHCFREIVGTMFPFPIYIKHTPPWFDPITNKEVGGVWEALGFDGPKTESATHTGMIVAVVPVKTQAGEEF